MVRRRWHSDHGLRHVPELVLRNGQIEEARKGDHPKASGRSGTRFGRLRRGPPAEKQQNVAEQSGKSNKNAATHRFDRNPVAEQLKRM